MKVDGQIYAQDTIPVEDIHEWINDEIVSQFINYLIQCSVVINQRQTFKTFILYIYIYIYINPFMPAVAVRQPQSAFFKIAIKPKPSIIYTQTFFEYLPHILK